MKKFPTVFVALFLMANIANAQEAVSTPAASPSASPKTSQAEQVTVTSQELDISREAIVPSLGATRYTIGPDRLDSQAQGENAPFNQTVLRFPAVAQDSHWKRARPAKDLASARGTVCRFRAISR